MSSGVCRIRRLESTPVQERAARVRQEMNAEASIERDSALGKDIDTRACTSVSICCEFETRVRCEPRSPSSIAGANHTPRPYCGGCVARNAIRSGVFGEMSHDKCDAARYHTQHMFVWFKFLVNGAEI
jgi:hypothetical protein